MFHAPLPSRIVAILFLAVAAVLSPLMVRAQECGTWLPGPISPDLPAGSEAFAFGAAGGNLYALVSMSPSPSVWQMSGAMWSRLPWDAQAMGNPSVLSTDTGVLSVLGVRLVSETTFPVSSRTYEYAIYTYTGATWNLVSSMNVVLSFASVSGSTNQSLTFNDMTFFNGAWYLAGRRSSSTGVNGSAGGVLYRSSGATISYFAGTNIGSCTLVCFNLPRLTTLQVVGGNLYIGGKFSSIGASEGPIVTAANLVRFDGSSFNALPTSPNDGVTGMFVENTVIAFPNLVVWGDFTQVGTTTHNHIARWSDFFGSWSGVGTGIVGTSGFAPITVVPISGNQTIDHIDYVAIGVSQAGGAAVDGLARWTGSAWQNYGGVGTSALVGSFRAGINFQGVTVGGTGLAVNGAPRYGASRWNGSAWTYVATQGTDGVGRALVRHTNETYIGGDFTRIDSVNTGHIARRDSVTNTWQPLGTGTNGPVLAMLSFNGELIAGGTFSTAGGVSASNIAAWNGTSWRALGAGLDDNVHALAVWNGSLVAAGAFQRSGGADVFNVARWTGSEWVPVDPGFQTTDVFAVAVYANTLYIGGDGGLWRLQSGEFQNVGSIATGDVRALFPLLGSLYVGGTFTAVGSPALNYRAIARYNGTNWFPVGPNAPGDFAPGAVNSITGNAAGLLVAGLFNLAAVDGTATNVARFDGISWRSLPVQATDKIVHAGLIVGTGAAIAGEFISIGDVESFSYGEWSATPVFADNPDSAEICLDVADSVSFSVAVNASVTPAYRWRRNGLEISDNLRISGATTPMITLAALSPEDSGQYDCVITNCSSFASEPATLTVRESGDPVCIGCPPCPADYDLDGGVTGSDIAAFFSDFEQGLPCADTDLDGGVTGSDIGAFFAAFEAGGCCAFLQRPVAITGRGAKAICICIT